MKYSNLIQVILFISFLISCKSQNNDLKNEINQENLNTKLQSFQSILDSANVKGSILIYDLEENKYFSNDFSWAEKGHLPASTFKIANSIIGLETKVVENDSTLFKWDGKKRALKNWEQDLIFREAFHFSCVPCYQDLARRIGTNSMNLYLDKLEYGEMKVNANNLDLFWLEGDSKISQFQQIEFLLRFHLGTLPISNRTESIMKRMMIIKQTEDYTLRGKTGWSIRGDRDNGWFVGYIIKQGKTYFFATNVEPNDSFNMKLFPQVRRQVTYDAMKHLEIL